MSKDPAFLFYSADFLVGTMLMTCEQVGQYIRLLCLQHQQGHLLEKHMLSVGCVKDDVVWSKFEVDELGRHYNRRLEDEIEKRIKYADSRRLNGLKGGRKPKAETETCAKHVQSICKAQPNHSVNENINENEDVIDVKKGESREGRFAEFYQQYPKHIAKRDAEKAFAKLKPDDTLFNAIMAGLAKWSISDAWTKDGGQYIPNPATWLNGNRWEDEVPTARKPQSDAERIMALVKNHREENV